MEWLSNLWNTFTGWWSSGFNSIIGWVLGLLNGFFGSLGEYFTDWLSDQGLTIAIPSGVFDITHDLFRGIGYIFPVAALLPIPAFMVSFYLLKLVFALYQWFSSTVIKRIKIKM